MKLIATLLISASLSFAQFFPFPGPGVAGSGGGGGGGGTGTSFGAHSYWRIYITASGGTTASLTELDFRAADGTKLSTGGTASVSSTGSGNVSYLLDGDKGAGWQSSGNPNTTPEWVQYHFATPADVYSVIMAAYAADAITGFRIDYSDAGGPGPWFTAKTYSSTSWGSSEFDAARAFAVVDPGTGEYLNYKLNITATQTGDPNVGELTLKTTTGGSQIASGGYCFASSKYSSDYCDLAFDGTSATLWAAGGGAPQYVGYSLPSAKHVAEFDLAARNDAAAYSPHSFALLGSNDGGATWTTLGTYTAGTWTTGGQVQTFTVN